MTWAKSPRQGGGRRYAAFSCKTAKWSKKVKKTKRSKTQVFIDVCWPWWVLFVFFTNFGSNLSERVYIQISRVDGF